MPSSISFRLLLQLLWPSFDHPYIGNSGWHGVFQQLMMGGRDCSHHVDPWPPENGIVGGGKSKMLNSVMILNESARTGNSIIPGERASFPSNP